MVKHLILRPTQGTRSAATARLSAPAGWCRAGRRCPPRSIRSSVASDGLAGSVAGPGPPAPGIAAVTSKGPGRW